MIPTDVKVLVASHPVDFRKGPDGLAALVRDAGSDPFNGSLYVFRARRAVRIKIVWWDRSGVCLYTHRQQDDDVSIIGSFIDGFLGAYSSALIRSGANRSGVDMHSRTQKTRLIRRCSPAYCSRLASASCKSAVEDQLLFSRFLLAGRHEFAFANL